MKTFKEKLIDIVVSEIADRADEHGDCVGLMVIVRPDGRVGWATFQTSVSALDLPVPEYVDRYTHPATAAVLDAVKAKPNA